MAFWMSMVPTFQTQLVQELVMQWREGAGRRRLVSAAAGEPIRQQDRKAERAPDTHGKHLFRAIGRQTGWTTLVPSSEG